MKLEDIQQAKLLDDQRRELAFKITLVRGNGLGVTIQGTYQDAEMLAAVRGRVVSVLEARIAGIDDELRAIGVDIEKELRPLPEELASELPILPRPRKSIGTAETQVGREPLVYAVSDMEAFGQACFNAGRRSARPNPAPSGDLSPAQIAEEDAWMDYKTGRGPRPARTPANTGRKKT